MNQHVAFLANTIGSVGCLIFHRRIPPAVEVDHMRSSGQVQSRAAGFDRDYKKRYVVLLLKSFHQIFSLRHRYAAVQYQSRFSKLRRKKLRQRFAHRLKLSEHQHLFLTIADRFTDIAKTQKFAALGRIECFLIQKLIGMIAQLLQPHEHRQYQPPTLNAVRFRKLLFHVGNHFFVQHGLLLRQPAFDFYFRLVGKIRHDIWIGLHSPQDIRPYKFSQS